MQRTRRHMNQHLLLAFLLALFRLCSPDERNIGQPDVTYGTGTELCHYISAVMMTFRSSSRV
jgi:hypothetical protein